MDSLSELRFEYHWHSDICWWQSRVLQANAQELDYLALKLVFHHLLALYLIDEMILHSEPKSKVLQSIKMPDQQIIKMS